ncbi:hypothetical protein [Thauera sp.]|jgi:hypothetical protein|uniref:hypothetical protein n=1 Tax=Thauera sp. TaxID=1905334 RepID=UPI00260915B6|nr:hypothetical protein [Thauera sp.]
MTAHARNRERGQALTEYLVALLVLMMLFGMASAGENSVVDTLLAAVRRAFERYSAFMSLPL